MVPSVDDVMFFPAICSAEFAARKDALR